MGLYGDRNSSKVRWTRNKEQEAEDVTRVDLQLHMRNWDEPGNHGYRWVMYSKDPHP